MRAFLKLLHCMVVIHACCTVGVVLGGPLDDGNELLTPERTGGTVNIYKVCLTNELTCKSGQCIPFKYKCDGKPDCVDNSDEIDCLDKCSWNQFKCTTSSKCISKLEVCNSITDCDDGSDEKYCSCGFKPESRPIKTIVGGINAFPGDWPWMVALIEIDADYPFCGGTLISDSHVLTAAHCFDRYSIEDIKVRLAEHNFDSLDDSEHIDFSIADIRIHEKYNDKTIENDIAILRLGQSTTFNKYISGACLPPPIDDFMNKTGFLLGWGKTYFESYTNSVLQELAITVWKQSKCVSAYKNFKVWIVTSDMICIGDQAQRRRKGSCQGDSGGPFLIEIDHKWHLVGIISWGSRCSFSYRPSVLTRVNSYLHWILEYTNYWKCSDEEYQCKGSRHCISTEALCDGTSDCFDSSDEENCDPCIDACDDQENAEHNCIAHNWKDFDCNYVCTSGLPINDDASNGCSQDPCIDACDDQKNAEHNCIATSWEDFDCNYECTLGLPIKGSASNGCQDPCIDACDDQENAEHNCKAINWKDFDCNYECISGFQINGNVSNGCSQVAVNLSDLGYSYYPNYGWLKFEESTIDWERGRATCIRDGSDLFALGNSDLEFINALHLKGNAWWLIGARRDGDDSPYERVSDQAVIPDSSAIWCNGQPSRSNEECVYYVVFNNCILDDECNSRGYLICQNLQYPPPPSFSGNPLDIGYIQNPNFGLLKYSDKYEQDIVGWNIGRGKCNQEGSDLFAPGENDLAFIEDLRLRGEALWVIGARRDGEGSPYKRVSDQSVLPDDSSLWCENEPNGSNENCVYYERSRSCLRNEMCSWPGFIICQILDQ